MLVCIFTGFSSGLPLYILISLLPAWLRSEGVNLKAIGLFALINLPFTWKFLWAPLFDRYIPPLGRRRGWLLISQILLLLSIPVFGAFNPKFDIWTIAYLASVVAFFSASQDIVLDAYRRELLLDSELGLGNAIHVNAYKIAGLIPFSAQTITHFTVRAEKEIPEKQPTIDEYAPLFLVRKDAPPMLLITGDRELEILGRYEENAYLMRMMKVSGHKDTRLFELDGYNHGMTEPAFPLLLNEVRRILDLKKA